MSVKPSIIMFLAILFTSGVLTTATAKSLDTKNIDQEAYCSVYWSDSPIVKSERETQMVKIGESKMIQYALILGYITKEQAKTLENTGKKLCE